MPTQKKIDTVAELKEKLERCTVAVATNYTGLNVNAMTDLRQRMRENDVEYMVVKNNLTYLAADAADRPEIKGIVQGPTALAFGYDDPIRVARVLEEYIRVNRSPLSIIGAVLEQRTLDAREVLALPFLPPKEVLFATLMARMQSPAATLMGQLQAPMVRLAGTLNGPLVSLAILLQRRAEQLESQGE
jgi:large subunit ribosomal protein L10